MRNAFSIARRIVTQIGMDKRTLALIIVAPVVMITLLWVVINGGLTTPAIALAGHHSCAPRRSTPCWTIQGALHGSPSTAPILR